MARGTLIRGYAALAAVAAVAIGPSSTVRAQDRGERDTRYLVGDGFELHGRLDAVWVGADDAPFLTALRDLARDVATRGLDLRVTRVASLGDVGDAHLVVVDGAAARAAAAVAALASDPRRAVLLLTEPASLADPWTLPAGVTSSSSWPWNSVAADGTGLRVAVYRPADGRSVTVGVAAPSGDLARVAHEALAATVLSANKQRLGSAFFDVSAHLVNGRVEPAVRLALDGTVRQSVVDLDGTVVVAEGPLGPIDVDALPSPDDALLCLAFDGHGISERIAVHLESVLRGRFHDVTCATSPTTYLGDDAGLRVLVRHDAGAPTAGVRVSARFAEGEAGGAVAVAESTTDALGVAVLRLPTAPIERSAEADGAVSRDVELTVADGWGARRFRARLLLRPRPAAVLQTDRARYRPGDTVHLRVFRFDARGTAQPSRRVAVRARDARDREVRVFEGTTDAFGAATFVLPLDRSAPPGAWTFDLDGVRTSFTVDDSPREPFDVRFVLDGGGATATGALRGRVEAFEWDGASLGDVAVTVSAGASRSETTGAGALPFALTVTDADDMVTLTAVVACGGRIARATRTVPVNRTDFDVAAPSVVRSGDAIDVVVQGLRDDAGVVDADLIVRGRLIGSASGRFDGGRATLQFAVPTDVCGAAIVDVRRRGVSRGVVHPLVVSALDVDLDAPASAAPGDTIPLTVRVRDASGAEVPALLDVRVTDPADGPAPLLDPLATRATGLRDVPLLRLDDGATAERIDAAARRVLSRAAEQLERAAALDAEAPWGARVHLVRQGGQFLLAVRRPRTGGGRALDAVATQPVPAGGSRALPLLLVARHKGYDVGADAGNDWMYRHRLLDGGWDTSVHGVCAGDVPCGDASGPRELRVGATSLAVLGYLGYGETHQAGSYRHAVRDGLSWLHDRQAADGFVGDRAAPNAVLQHALATIALSDAYGMTSSRRLRPGAESSLAALIALQRDDGGFGETGWTSSGVFLTTLGGLALKSARMAELDVDPDAWARLVAWTERHVVDPELTAEERATAPFGNGRPRRTAAACLFLLRTVLGTPSDAEGMAALLDRIVSDLPRADRLTDDDPASLWVATCAAFHAGGSVFGGGARRDVWATWNNALKPAVVDQHETRRDVCSYGSMPAIGGTGRFVTSGFAVLCQEFYYRYSHVFGRDVADRPRARTWFDAAAFRDLARVTAEDGAASLDVVLPDQLTTWDVAVGALDARGRYGAARRDVIATLPLGVTADVPLRLCVGDVVRVPLTVRTSLDAGSTCSLDVVASSGLELVGPPPATVTVDATRAVRVDVVVRAASLGAGTLTARVTRRGDAPLGDAVERTIDVVAVEDAVPTVLPIPVGRVVALPAPRGPATLRIRTSTVGLARSSLSALIRRPTGCFEQTTATLVPAHLAWRLLGARADDAGADPLRSGVQRLYRFEAPDGGFGPFVDRPARADLTALGIHALLDLSDLIAPDPAVLGRAAEFLEANVPDDGAARWLAVAALRRLGRGTDLAIDTSGADPYVLATAVNLGLLDGAATADAVRRLASQALREGDVARWTSSAESASTGSRASDVESTGAVVEALAAHGGDGALVTAGMAFLLARQRADGAWTTTRDTVAVLRAVSVAQERLRPTRLSVTVGDTSPRPLDASQDALDVDVPAWTPGATLRLDADRDVVACLVTAGDGAAAAPSGEIALDVEWPEGPLAAGETVTCTVRLSNLTDRNVTAPTVELRLPGCATADRRDVLDAARAAGFAWGEVRGGRVVLYGEQLYGGATLHVRMPLLLRHAGTFATGGAVAYPYYDPDRRSPVPGPVLDVSSAR